MGERPSIPDWLVLENATAKSKGNAMFKKQEDGSFLVSGENPEFDTFTFTAPVPLTGITAVKLEALADKSLPKRGPGRADNGNFALSDFRLSLMPTGSTNAVDLKIAKATATFA